MTEKVAKSIKFLRLKRREPKKVVWRENGDKPTLTSNMPALATIQQVTLAKLSNRMRNTTTISGDIPAQHNKIKKLRLLIKKPITVDR